VAGDAGDCQGDKGKNALQTAREGGTYMANEVKCINCGYLCAWDPKGHDVEDCIGDPELLRNKYKSENDFPINPHGLISGRPVRFRAHGALPYTIKHREFIETEEFKCYKRGCTLVPYVMNHTEFKHFHKLYRAHVCPAYFAYQTGFSAPQHLKLEIEKERAKQQEEFEEEMQSRQERWGRKAFLIAGFSVFISFCSLIWNILTN